MAEWAHTHMLELRQLPCAALLYLYYNTNVITQCNNYSNNDIQRCCSHQVKSCRGIGYISMVPNNTIWITSITKEQGINTMKREISGCHQFN